MGDLNIIDRFMQAFIRYIDSGFGLLGGDVHFLTTVLIGIDITLAGLFWAMGGEDDIIGRFLKKILYVGAFALILNSFSTLADIIFKSFAGLGLTVGGGGMTADDLLKPGKLAGTGFTAAWPLLDQASQMLGFTTFFDNFITIMVLLIAWVIVIVAFFILAVQLFITIIEFKLTTLAGFVLVPFSLWNRTSFLAERVLGNVISSGIKVMVLAVIVGIGSGFFSEFVAALQGQEPDIGQAMSLVLASLALSASVSSVLASRPVWSPVHRSSAPALRSAPRSAPAPPSRWAAEPRSPPRVAWSAARSVRSAPAPRWVRPRPLRRCSAVKPAARASAAWPQPPKALPPRRSAAHLAWVPPPSAAVRLHGPRSTDHLDRRQPPRRPHRPPFPSARPHDSPGS